MISKFALAFKAKTFEFFAEEEEDVDETASTISALDLASAPEEIITGQRVVVLKPDPPPTWTPDDVISSVFAAVSSFRTAYLQLQAAHSPLDSDAIMAADSNAVKQLQIISDIKHDFYLNGEIGPRSVNPSQNLSFLEAQVKENQTLLRTFETVFNRLQADIDKKDLEVASLRMKIKEVEAENVRLKKMAKKWKTETGTVANLLTVGLFDSLVKDCCREMHRFSKMVIALMKKSSTLDFDYVANLIYPGVKYAKAGHWRYAILSYICLGMFDGFDSSNILYQSVEAEFDEETTKKKSLNAFIEHLANDQFEEPIQRNPEGDFAKFCSMKYNQLITKCAERSIFGNWDETGSLLGSLNPLNPLYQSFIDMASSVWLLHKLAFAYDPKVEIFQVGRGKEFSIVFMENVVKTVSHAMVGFTVVPGFRVGKTVIQCRVYLECSEADNL